MSIRAERSRYSFGFSRVGYGSAARNGNRAMRRELPILALTLMGLCGAGCATHTGTGALAGSAVGAGAGAAVGSMTGNAGLGALIGSGLGAATGGLVGAGLDENDRRNEARIAAATAKPVEGPLSVADIVQMSASGISEEVVVSSLQSSDSVFQLTAPEIIQLHNQGVSDRVIQAMLDSSRRAATTVVRPGAVVYERAPVYVVEPPPRVTFGFGYGFGPCWHRRPCW